MLIDTHCHLEMMLQYEQIATISKENYQTVEKIIDDAKNNNVTTLVTIGTTYERCLHGVTFAQKYDPVFATIGIHPCDITDSWQEELKKLAQLIPDKKNKIVGIGETGLDFYHPGFNVELQKKVFRHQIELALTHNLAIVVHSRSAIDETLQILQEYKKNNLRGVIHCFGENISVARDIQQLNFMMGIAAIITYPKNESLRDAVRTLQLDNMVFETDSPFLPPQHLRGKQNSPAQVYTVAQYCAELLNLPLETVAEKTTKHAQTLFQF